MIGTSLAYSQGNAERSTLYALARDPSSAREAHACSSVPSTLKCSRLIKSRACKQIVEKKAARFYRMARRSAIEVVAWLDITRQRKEADPAVIQQTMDTYAIVVAMLVRLIKSLRQ